eukprot:scaffold14950_cov14-Tisochrysis_lutea.AAC.1
MARLVGAIVRAVLIVPHPGGLRVELSSQLTYSKCCCCEALSWSPGVVPLQYLNFSCGCSGFGRPINEVAWLELRRISLLHEVSLSGVSDVGAEGQRGPSEAQNR